MTQKQRFKVWSARRIVEYIRQNHYSDDPNLLPLGVSPPLQRLIEIDKNWGKRSFIYYNLLYLLTAGGSRKIITSPHALVRAVQILITPRKYNQRLEYELKPLNLLFKEGFVRFHPIAGVWGFWDFDPYGRLGKIEENIHDLIPQDMKPEYIHASVIEIEDAITGEWQMLKEDKKLRLKKKRRAKADKE